MAVPAHDVTFRGDGLTDPHVRFDVRADLDHLTGKLVSEHEGGGNPALRPRIPLGDVQVGPAHARVLHADQDVVGATRRRIDLGEFESWPRM